MAQRYPQEIPGALAWTQTLPWGCVYNIEDFEGKTDGDRYQAAKTAAIAQGGGVIYFPAGVYQFTEDLVLAQGIVLRGEASRQPDAKAAAYKPLTEFQFPRYEPSATGTGTANTTAFKKIRTESPDTDSNLGLVDLDINRAGIEWVADADRGTNRNLLVLGIRSNNVAEPDPKVPDLSFQPASLRYSYRFAANVRLQATGQILVANNRLNDAITDSYDQPGYVVKALKGDGTVTYRDGDRVPFDYGNHYGIVVNRSKAGGFRYASEPAQEPSLFRPGIVILDNWVYHTMRVGIQASGQGLRIQGNVIQDQPDKQTWTDPTGLKQPQGSVTLENRAIDWSGHEVVIANNLYEVYRHKIMDTPYFSVDGEGILIQECCGGTSVQGLKLLRNRGNGYIGLYKVPQIQNVQIRENRVEADGEALFVSADTNHQPGRLEQVAIEHNRFQGDIRVIGSAGGQENTVDQNQGSGTIRSTCNVEVGENPGFAIEPCKTNAPNSNNTNGSNDS